MSKEIERKWLFDGGNETLDDLKRIATKVTHIRQRYFHDENPDNSVARVRQYFSVEQAGFAVSRRLTHISSEITCKSGTGMERAEINVPIDKDLAADLMCPNADVVIIEKTRYEIPIPADNLVIELDIYESDNKGLIHIEIEFPTTLKAKEFTPISWFGREVTNDVRHTNAELQNNPYQWWK